MIRNHGIDNGTCIFTQNSYYTEKFINEANVGMVGVCAPYPYLAFGEIKGLLVDNINVQGKDVINFFTQRKVATVRVATPKGNNLSGAKPANSNVRSCVAS